MINLNYFVFKRNNYYSGKMLMAADFESEQKYNNDKRRLANRFISGFGIVNGFDVVALTDDTISIESGFALDGCGREIVMTEPEVKKLSDIKGYEAAVRNRDMFLFLEYQEKNSEHIGELSETKEKNSDKITEGGNFYFSDIDDGLLDVRSSAADVFNKKETVFFESEAALGVMITPRYIGSGEKFVLTLKFIPRDTEEKLRVKTTVRLSCVRYSFSDHIDVDFTSAGMHLTDGAYSVDYICDSMNVSDDIAEFTVNPDSLLVEANGVNVSGKGKQRAEAVITRKDPALCVMNEFSGEIMEYVMNNPYRDICIAKITMRQDKPGVIQEITELPFLQKVYTNSELALWNKIISEKLWILEDESKKNTDIESRDPKIREQADVSSGETVIKLGIGGKAGKRFYSEEIEHGLGIGNVMVSAGIIRDDQEKSCVYGSGEIFDLNPRDVKAEIAVKVNRAKGTFVIGIRLLESSSDYEIPISWTAIKKKEINKNGDEKKIIIDIGVESLRIMESTYFSVKFVNMNETTIRWSVENENCGIINNNGYYTAPNRPGVYEIRAVCAGDENIYASTFIVVKP